MRDFNEILTIKIINFLQEAYTRRGFIDKFLTNCFMNASARIARKASLLK